MPTGRVGATGVAATSSQRWNAGSSSSAAHGLTTQTAIEPMTSASDSAAAAPGLSGAGSRPASRGRANAQVRANNRVQMASETAARPSSA